VIVEGEKDVEMCWGDDYFGVVMEEQIWESVVVVETESEEEAVS
jgi:hypothetical protein